MTMSRSRALLLPALLVPALLSPRLAHASPIDATHEIAVADDHLRVTTHWYGQIFGEEWRFAAPLPIGTRLVSHDLTPILADDGLHIVGVAVPPGQTPYPLVVELELPHHEGDELIPLPVPVDAGWQRVAVEGEYRLIPTLGPALPMHTAGYYAPGELHAGKRLRVDQNLDGRHPAGAAYLPGSVLIEAGGLPAQLESGAARKSGLGFAAGAVFFSGLVVLGLILRRQSGIVEVEDAQSYLDEEFRNLATETAEPS